MHTHTDTGDPLSLGSPSSFSSRTGGRQAPDYADSEPPALRRRRRRRKKRRLGRKPAAGARRDAPRGRLDASGRGRTPRGGERRPATRRSALGWIEIVERKRWGDREGEGTADFAMGGGTGERRRIEEKRIRARADK